AARTAGESSGKASSQDLGIFATGWFLLIADSRALKYPSLGGGCAAKRPGGRPCSGSLSLSTEANAIRRDKPAISIPSAGRLAAGLPDGYFNARRYADTATGSTAVCSTQTVRGAPKTYSNRSLLFCTPH